MSNFATKCKTYYEKGLYTLAMLEALVTKGKLTEDELAEITGGSDA